MVALFAAIGIIGLATGFWLKEPLYDHPQALGVHTIGLLVPFVGSTAFAVAAVFLDRFGPRTIAATFGLFLVLIVPFVDLLSLPITHPEGNDSYRYSVYAHHILKERTLWGAGGLLHSFDYYFDQPGYRYYLAATIGLLGGEHRGLQLFNMAVLLSGTLGLLWTIQPSKRRPEIRGLAVFLLGAAPYAAKNVLNGYTEWFVVLLFMLFVTQALRHRWLTSIILISLIPFVRQNLLAVSLILAIGIVLTTRNYWLILPYFFLLGLPIYHNLYYADQFLFFTKTGLPVELGTDLLENIRNIARKAFSKIPHYLGYKTKQDLDTLAIAVMFAPFGTGLSFWLFSRLESWRRWVYFLVIASAVGPTMIFGWGSFPRFVYVNLFVIILSFWVVNELQLNQAEEFEGTH
jgi:hypothetical protein